MVDPQTSEFLWLGNISDPLMKLPSTKAAPIVLLPLATDFRPLTRLTSVLKTVLGVNFIPALGMLGGMLMGLGYQDIIRHYGYCPGIIATGGLSCGKTTTLKALLCAMGSLKSGLCIVIQV